MVSNSVNGGIKMYHSEACKLMRFASSERQSGDFVQLMLTGCTLPGSELNLSVSDIASQTPTPDLTIARKTPQP